MNLKGLETLKKLIGDDKFYSLTLIETVALLKEFDLYV